MFEIPEYVTLARQMCESLSARRIAKGTLGNSPHKFVWYNRLPDEFAAIVKRKDHRFGLLQRKMVIHSHPARLPARIWRVRRQDHTA